MILYSFEQLRSGAFQKENPDRPAGHWSPRPSPEGVAQRRSLRPAPSRVIRGLGGRPSGHRGGVPTRPPLLRSPVGPTLTFRVRRGDEGEVPVGGRIGRGRARRLHPAGLGAHGGAGARLGPGPRTVTTVLAGGLRSGRRGLGRGRRCASQATRLPTRSHRSPAGGERPSTTTPAP